MRALFSHFLAALSFKRGDSGVKKGHSGVKRPDSEVKKGDPGAKRPDLSVKRPDSGVKKPDSGLKRAHFGRFPGKKGSKKRIPCSKRADVGDFPENWSVAVRRMPSALPVTPGGRGSIWLRPIRPQPPREKAGIQATVVTWRGHAKRTQSGNFRPGISLTPAGESSAALPGVAQGFSTAGSFSAGGASFSGAAWGMVQPGSHSSPAGSALRSLMRSSSMPGMWAAP